MCCSKKTSRSKAQHGYPVLPTPAPTPAAVNDMGGGPPSYTVAMKQHDLAFSPNPNPNSNVNPAVDIDILQIQDHKQNPSCLAHGHIPKTKYGKLGIAAGVVFFPWGLFWTHCDSWVICQACDTVLKPKKCGAEARLREEKNLGMREKRRGCRSGRRGERY